MLFAVKEYIRKRNDPERKKARQEALDKNLVILKQKKIEQFETRQEWNVVFGKEKPAKKKDLLKFKDVTLRNIWMEENFIYNQAVRMNPGEILHKPEEYALEWRPPDSAFRVMIHISDQKAQADTLQRISYYPKPLQKSIIFYFTTLSKNKDLFGEKVHPSASESFHDRPSVLRKLCQKYMMGAVSLEDFNMILEAGYNTWKVALYNLLDEEEQSYHPYLQNPPPKVSKKSLERQYLDDNIDLQRYEDLKFPARKAKKDEESLSYPRPYDTKKCIICKEDDVAIVKCLHCSNYACPKCISKVFIDKETAEGSFLLLHRRFCTRLGAFPVVVPQTEPEPAYLRELRATGSLAAQRQHQASYLSEEERKRMIEEAKRQYDDDETDDESESEDEEPPAPEEKSLEDRDDGPKIMKFLSILQSCVRKLQNAESEIKKMHLVLDNPRRGVTVRERMQRIKNEKVAKLERTLKKVAKCRKVLNKFEELETVSEPLAEASKNVETVQRLLSITTWEEYEEMQNNIKKEEEARASASLMSLAL